MKEEDELILITVEEAARLLHIGRNRMLQLVKIKGFPAILFPHQIRIVKELLPVWVAKNIGRFK